MKATLNFNLDDPDDQEKFREAQNAPLFRRALYEIDQELRKIDKYEELSDVESEMIKRVRSIFYGIVKDIEYS